ncbi:hypothetical protein [Mycobacterium sp. 94-17]|uniref:hypothetical protein n=1 Tax=Mycobacterium sp. 94-17 TaxID=2986147 RepID=UPI002D1F20BC|nr:hypothetical protein [Mycobacterium sp. 94-17]MEB4210965.1 hypothetical protein [Mycobacterium sp. 94-17]
MTNPYEAPGEVFGYEPDEGAGSWGAGDIDDVGDERPLSGDLGDGLGFIRINEDVWRSLLRDHPQVQAAVMQRAQAIADAANDNATSALDPRTVERLAPGGEPAYLVKAQDNPHATRFRARVVCNPETFLGVLAEAQESSLLAATLANPSDPIPGAEQA